MRERERNRDRGRTQNGCDKTTAGRLRTSHKRGEPVAITRQMFVVGEVSYRHYREHCGIYFGGALKHFAPNGLQLPAIMNINLLRRGFPPAQTPVHSGIRQLHQPCVMRGCENKRITRLGALPVPTVHESLDK